MNLHSGLQIAIYLVILLGLSVPLGLYMAKVFTDSKKTFLHPVIEPLEKLTYKICGIDPSVEMNWQTYAVAMMLFQALGLFVTYGLQRLQGYLPLNPQHLGPVSADSSFNTAISFVSNTNWQGYGGETTMSYLTQMLSLNVQNFVSAAAGIAVLIALIRAFTVQDKSTIGNFWVDLVRSAYYVLLPLSVVLALILSFEGAVQTFDAYTAYTPLEKVGATQTATASTAAALAQRAAAAPAPLIALGPAASQIAIKQLGTNGGGFFNVNSSHPFENPTPLTNLAESISILVISAALCFTFGKMVGDTRQGIAMLAAMSIIWIFCLAGCLVSESTSSPQLSALKVDAAMTDVNPGGNMEGKETRFGIANSAIWAVATTAASNGSVNSMHDSYNPLGGLCPMFLMQLGEVIYGGVGSGLYGMLIFALIAVFIAGLMVGRTPEYLGKKIESFEIKMSSLVILVPPFVVLVGTAVAVSCDPGKATVFNPGAHGFSEVLYAFSSAGNNNGSAFAGLGANTPFYNYALGIAMFCARYWLAIPVLAVAGSLSRKKLVPASLGTMPTHNLLFVTLLVSVVLIVGALTFVPALALGPVVEHLNMIAAGKTGVETK
ncbi:MAG: potassium-transporting ATPase subunit KdpA [Candidatus Obscuribacterales bacterium]